MEGILEVCGIVDYTLEKTDAPTFHPGRNAAVLSSNKQIGIFGEAHPEVLENYDLPYKAYLFDFDMEALVDAAIFAKRFEPIPVYPKVERDLAIVVDKEVLSDMPTGLIYATGGELVESVRLFDLYEGEQVPEGKKSLALRDYVSFCNRNFDRQGSKCPSRQGCQTSQSGTWCGTTDVGAR